MANTRSIKSRIKSAKNIAQITKAMEMVSASKMRKAQDRLRLAVPYAEKLRQVLYTLASQVTRTQHPLLQNRTQHKKALVIVLSSDKGLAGALNSNVFRDVGMLLRKNREQDIETEFVSIGRKGRDFLRYTRRNLAAVYEGFGDSPSIPQVQSIVTMVTEEFLAGKYDSVTIAYSEFISTLVQKAAIRQLLPIALPTTLEASAAPYKGPRAKPLFEPSPDAILEWLMPYYLEQQIYYYAIQANASEHSARMIAMKNATDNAKDVRKELELAYNSARQSQITQQIAEIASATMV